jgi:hypothetical protein
MDFDNRDRMSPYCVRLSAVTARIWNGLSPCGMLARSRRRPSYGMSLQTLPKLIVLAKLVTCVASWCSPFADSS